jgi:hypothetical protein
MPLLSAAVWGFPGGTHGRPDNRTPGTRRRFRWRTSSRQLPASRTPSARSGRAPAARPRRRSTRCSDSRAAGRIWRRTPSPGRSSPPTRRETQSRHDAGGGELAMWIVVRQCEADGCEADPAGDPAGAAAAAGRRIRTAYRAREDRHATLGLRREPRARLAAPGSRHDRPVQCDGRRLHRDRRRPLHRPGSAPRQHHRRRVRDRGRRRDRPGDPEDVRPGGAEDRHPGRPCVRVRGRPPADADAVVHSARSPIPPPRPDARVSSAPFLRTCPGAKPVAWRNADAVSCEALRGGIRRCGTTAGSERRREL